jgi:[lysine-biosynthesis-protein LysW]--L-2-aminoadipate ligase
VTVAIGVLSARIRVEEKQVLQALAEAGVPARPLAPAACPFPVSPVPTPPGAAGRLASLSDAMFDCAPGCEVIVDRLSERTLAAALLPLWRSQGKVILGAGLAATGNRAGVAAALTAAGLPRPETFLAPTEEAALAALDQLVYPATLLPLGGGAAVTLWDRDSAEAVLEHRSVLGGATSAVVLVQGGAPAATERALVHVVGGAAVAAADPGGLIAAAPAAVALAEAAAHALGADVAGVEIALTEAGLVVWDVPATPDFRDAAPLHGQSVAAAVAALAAAHLAARPAFKRAVTVEACPERGEWAQAGEDGAIDGEAQDGPAAVRVVPNGSGEAALPASDWQEVRRDAALTA